MLILKPIKSLFDQPQFLGPCFLASSALLFASIYSRFPFHFHSQIKWQDSLIIGLFQSVAVLPGISRSGSTISAARLLGWSKEEAVQFSFLLAIPAILGGTLLELRHVLQSPTESLLTENPWIFIVGFLTSAIVGVLSLRVLIRMVIHDQWSVFAWYCFALGIATTLYFNFFV